MKSSPLTPIVGNLESSISKEKELMDQLSKLEIVTDNHNSSESQKVCSVLIQSGL